MRAVLAAEEAGDERAALAVAVYVHRLRASIAGMAAAMEGADAICFTAVWASTRTGSGRRPARDCATTASSSTASQTRPAPATA